MQQTSDGGYIVTGGTWSFGTPNEANIWLIKLDSLGHKVWDQTFEGGWGYSVRQTSDGGYIVVGNKIIRTDDNGEPTWIRDFGGTGYCVQIANDGNYIISGSQSLSLWLIKLNDNGDSLWAKTYQIGNSGDVGRYVEQTTDNGYIITGSFCVEDSEIQDYRFGIWLLKADEHGDTTWTRTYGGDNWGDLDHGYCVRQTGDEGYIIAGTLNSFTLLKTDSDGNISWVQTYGRGTGRCVEQLWDGNYIVTGEAPPRVGCQTLTGENLWLIKTDPNGDTLWTRDYGNVDTDEGRYLQQTSDSGYIVTGYTWSYGPGTSDLWVIKTDSLGLLNAISEEPTLDTPANWKVVSSVGSQIILRYTNRPTGFNALVFDALGRKVDEIYATGSAGIITWGVGQVPGVYIIRVRDKNKATTAKVVLVR